jgi:hypothetical protein
MLFQRRFHDGIRSGQIRCTVRIWQRPHAKVGGRYTLGGGGAIVVDKIQEVSLDDITPAVAQRCGFPSLVDLLKTARSKLTTGSVSSEELALLVQRLEAMDRRSPAGAWTLATLRAIEARPGVLAATLARSLGRPRDEFKRDVRKLKHLGLTFSLEIGYRLTPKGEALLASLSSR